LGKLLQKPVPATPERLEALQGPLLLTPKANGVRALLVCEGATAVLSLAGGILLPLTWTTSDTLLTDILLAAESPSIYDGEFVQDRRELWLFDLLAHNGQDWRGAAPRERLAKLSTLLPHGLTCLSAESGVLNSPTTLVVQLKPVFEATNAVTTRVALDDLDKFVKGATAPPTDGILIQEAAVPFLAPLKHKTWPTIDVQLVFGTAGMSETSVIGAKNTVPMVCVRAQNDGSQTSQLCPLVLHGQPVTLCTPLPHDVREVLAEIFVQNGSMTPPPCVIVEGALVASETSVELNKEDVSMEGVTPKMAFQLRVERLRPDRTGPNTEADCLDVAALVANGWHTRSWLEHALMVERWGSGAAVAQKRTYTQSVTESVPWDLWHQLWKAACRCRNAPSFAGGPVPVMGALPSTWVHELWRLGARFAYVPPYRGFYISVVSALSCNEETRSTLMVVVKEV
jgi:hypothetical protein